MRRGILFVLASMLLIGTGCARKNDSLIRNPYNLDLVQTLEDYNLLVAGDPNMKIVDLEKMIPGLALDIRYATTNNFTGAVIYTAPKALARKPVAEALHKVEDSLSFYRLGLKIYDAYRPYAASLRFFEVYPDTNFVANPRKGSRHNRGCALDLTLIELSTGQEIPMPTLFDDFSPKAHPDYPDLPDTVLANRKFLFDIMLHFGFMHYPTEWWHFDYQGWENYKLMDLSFEELEK
jgi:zinc D-Ala-D-Ala dipeptidase